MNKIIEKGELKYMQVAEGIEQLIHEDIFKIGDKLPSVRLLSNEQGISVGTAFQAYYHLEGKGLIESRPKSGYYVRYNTRRMPGVPATIVPFVKESEVSINEMVADVYNYITADDLINFSFACPDISLLPAARINKSVVHAIRSNKNHCLHYEHLQGNVELRKQIARLCFNWGAKLTGDDIMITSGCMEAMMMCLKAVTKAGDTVAIESPTYFGIFQAMESLGLKVVEIPCDPVTGMDLAAFEKAIKKFNIKAAVVVPSFNNPTGSCMPDANKKKLVELITKYQVPLIEDDIYGELYFGKNRPRTCKTFDKEGMVLYCSSLSKSLAPGYRIGWCIGGRFLNEIRHLKSIHNLSAPTITQVAIAHFLSIGRFDYHLKQLRKSLHVQCLRYIQAISEYFPESTCTSRPEGGFVLWLELDKKIDSYKLYKEALKHHISVAPGRIFSTHPDYSHCIRISYGKPFTPDIEHGLRVLGQLVKKMSR
ncbi:MAG: PLP-dependent aminotransferase family protein [Chitinophagaceae bacterium]|nr:PLP-dependent aminotransferase family protein [Chitinophagaceae bacterium]